MAIRIPEVGTPINFGEVELKSEDWNDSFEEVSKSLFRTNVNSKVLSQLIDTVFDINNLNLEYEGMIYKTNVSSSDSEVNEGVVDLTTMTDYDSLRATYVPNDRTGNTIVALVELTDGSFSVVEVNITNPSGGFNTIFNIASGDMPSVTSGHSAISSFRYVIGKTQSGSYLVGCTYGNNNNVLGASNTSYFCNTVVFNSVGSIVTSNEATLVTRSVGSQRRPRAPQNYDNGGHFYSEGDINTFCFVHTTDWRWGSDNRNNPHFHISRVFYNSSTNTFSNNSEVLHNTLLEDSYQSNGNSFITGSKVVGVVDLRHFRDTSADNDRRYSFRAFYIDLDDNSNNFSEILYTESFRGSNLTGGYFLGSNYMTYLTEVRNFNGNQINIGFVGLSKNVLVDSYIRTTTGTTTLPSFNNTRLNLMDGTEFNVVISGGSNVTPFEFKKNINSKGQFEDRIRSSDVGFSAPKYVMEHNDNKYYFSISGGVITVHNYVTTTLEIDDSISFSNSPKEIFGRVPFYINPFFSDTHDNLNKEIKLVEGASEVVVNEGSWQVLEGVNPDSVEVSVSVKGVVSGSPSLPSYSIFYY